MLPGNRVLRETLAPPPNPSENADRQAVIDGERISALARGLLRIKPMDEPLSKVAENYYSITHCETFDRLSAIEFLKNAK